MSYSPRGEALISRPFRGVSRNLRRPLPRSEEQCELPRIQVVTGGRPVGIRGEVQAGPGRAEGRGRIETGNAPRRRVISHLRLEAEGGREDVRRERDPEPAAKL